MAVRVVVPDVGVVVMGSHAAHGSRRARDSQRGLPAAVGRPLRKTSYLVAGHHPGGQPPVLAAQLDQAHRFACAIAVPSLERADFRF